MGNWVEKKLSEVCNISIGGTPARANSEYWDVDGQTENFWVSIRDMNQKVIQKTSEKLSKKGIQNSNAKLVKKGTVLLSFKLSIGKVAIADVDLFTNEAIAALEALDIDDKFLFHGLQYWNLLQDVDQAVKGATLNKEKLKKIKFKIPEKKEEQSSIATILTTIDQAIEKTEQLIAKYERIKTGLMQDLLTCGIDEQGNIRSEVTHEFKDSVLGRIPKEWEKIKISDLGVWKGGKTPRKSNSRYWNNGKHLWFTSKDVVEGLLSDSVHKITLEAIDETSQNVFPAFKSLIFVFRSGILRHTFPIAISDKVFSVNQDIKVLVPKAEFLPEFLYQKFKSLELYFLKTAVKAGTTVESVDGKVFFTTEIGLPGQNEQLRISNALKTLDIQTQCLISELRKSTNLKTSLMQDLLTGKVRVDGLIQKIAENQ